MKNRVGIALCGLLLWGLLAGCGSSGGKNVAVNMREFSFSPDEFEVPAGAEVTLNLNNLGALNHNLHIMAQGSEVEEMWEEGYEDDAILNVEIVERGKSTSVTFTAPTEPGEYQFLCSVPAHFQQGMVGTMRVTGP